MFNVLTSRIDFDEAKVLDLYGGTGALGFEAISRGAATCLFIDSNPAVLDCCRDNAATLDISDQCRFLRFDVQTYMEQNTRPAIELILADPPYGATDVSELPEMAIQLLVPDGLFALEHDKRIDFSEHQNLVTSKSYGRTHVSFFSNSEDNE